MITLKFTEEEKEALNYERTHHPDPRVQRKMEALWLKSQGESHQRIAQLTGVTVNVVTEKLVSIWTILYIIRPPKIAQIFFTRNAN